MIFDIDEMLCVFNERVFYFLGQNDAGACNGNGYGEGDDNVDIFEDGDGEGKGT